MGFWIFKKKSTKEESGFLLMKKRGNKVLFFLVRIRMTRSRIVLFKTTVKEIQRFHLV